MISRQWRGIAKTTLADTYIAHLRTQTFPQLATLGGFVSASILRRPVEDGVEFLIITEWESLEAIGKFAGARADRAVVPEQVKDMMIRFDESVLHYEVVQ
jgi:heme-degrading monooxygenase HmoA